MNFHTASSEELRPPLRIRVFCAVHLAASMGLLAVLFVPYGVGAEGTSSPLFLGSWAVLYSLTLIFSFQYRVGITKGDWPIIAFCGLALFSVLWTDDPQRTLTYGIAFLANATFALLLRRFFSLPAFLKLLLRVIVVMSIAGATLRFSGFEQARYIDVHDRITLIGTEPIRGLSNHKITAALYAALGFILASQLLGGVKRILSCAILLLFILLTGSSSGLALLLLGTVIVYILKWASRRLALDAAAALAITISSFVIAFLLIDSASVLALLGRDATLTGRTELWAWGADVGSVKPIFGWGFLGYMGSEQALAYARTIPGFTTYEAPHFHNSFIQMFVELGLIGLIICLIILARSTLQLYNSALKTRSIEAITACAIVLMLSIAAIFVHVFMKYNDLPTLIILFMGLLSSKRNEEKLSFRDNKFGPQKAFELV